MKVLVSVITVAAVASVVTSQAQRCTARNGNPGRCVEVQQCPRLHDLLIRRPPGAIDILRGAICSFTQQRALVCCEDAPAVVSPGPSVNRLRGRQLLPRQCGHTALVDRIIGEPAPLLSWPWMILLRGQNAEGRRRFFCGGVLLSERYVLTAAHCVHKGALLSLESVRVGEHTVGRDPDCQKNVCAPSPQDIAVEQVIVHEAYGSPCLSCNDIALLRLATPARIDNLYVTPVCLPLEPLRDLGFSARDLKTKRAWVAGWGATEALASRTGTGTFSNVLQHGNLPISDRFCKQDLRDYPDPDMVLCAGGEDHDACNGDSGGPMVISNSNRTRRYVIGVVSRGPTVCGAPESSGIYTSVIYYMDWILSNLRA
ncbi:phenoloxidase-activating factor 1-like [Penaeus monodon]|uniref:phenoloxidase-activating factor 1-like n=1 Tax=Penaeus monodon TaxID=6687 RepID=UPI0018A6D82C|nr:phenoloxidase-activating factor 1-like [Penaeus monodon]XP_037789162.1 phenoloxidase-activating factor 1-like [Penaeus monodon]